jgi:hypothetical protein
MEITAFLERISLPELSRRPSSHTLECRPVKALQLSVTYGLIAICPYVYGL